MAISPVLLIGLICLASSGSLFPTVKAIWLTLPDSGDRCFFEDIPANTVVIFDYLCVKEDTYAFGYTLDIRIMAPGKELYKKTNVTSGEFSFTTSELGTYVACLSLHQDQSHHNLSGPAIVSIDWRIGIRTKDWDSVAKKEKIEGVELQLRKSTELAGYIKANQVYIKYRDNFLWEMSEKTNKRIAQLSSVSLGVSFIVSLFQIWHLKRFFLKKKLI